MLFAAAEFDPRSRPVAPSPIRRKAGTRRKFLTLRIWAGSLSGPTGRRRLRGLQRYRIVILGGFDEAQARNCRRCPARRQPRPRPGAGSAASRPATGGAATAGAGAEADRGAGAEGGGGG